MRCVALPLCALTLLTLSQGSHAGKDDESMVETSLMVNQLAILEFINGSGTFQAQQRRHQTATLQDDVTTLKAEMALIKDLMQAFRPEPEANSVEVTALREEVLTMRKAILVMREENLAMHTTIVHHEEERHQVNSVVQSFLPKFDALNQTLIAQGEKHELAGDTISSDLQSLKAEMEAVTAKLEASCENVREEQEKEIQALQEKLQQLNTTFIDAFTDCVVEGEFSVNDDCSISECFQGYLHPYQGQRAANVSANKLIELGCVQIYTDNFVSWNAAREICKNLGGDLFVAGDFNAIIEAFRDEITGLGPWIGAKSRRWLDGRELNEWAINQPNGPTNYCVNGYPDLTTVGAWDSACEEERPYICQMAVAYP